MRAQNATEHASVMAVACEFSASALKFFMMEMSDDFLREILQDGGSDDEAFTGFSLEECSESERKRIKSDLETAQLIADLENDVHFSAADYFSSDEEEDFDRRLRL